ncbi:MAG: protein kinase domain-containing protein [Solirubrobacteraceae bacterium]
MMTLADHPSSLGGGRYVIGRFLGEGRSKRVYHARDLRLARDVAIAVVRLDGLSPQARSAVRREAERSGRLGDHPNIVAIYDVDVEGEVPYVVHEYVPEQSLAEALDRAPGRRLAREAVLAIGADVSAALAHAHARGMVHRALKPKRIWLAERGVLVGDFGLAAGAGQGRFTEEGSALGTVHYTAPEQLLGKPVDGRADLYALGALLYELACGRPPFSGPGADTVIAQHLEQDPPPPSELCEGLPPELDALVLALLAKDPGLRPSSAGTVRAALLALDRSQRSQRSVPAPVAPALARDTDDALELLDRAFVGRGDELGRLQGAFTEACAGAGRVALVAGQAGMGKTRLADELAHYAESHGAYVLWGRCHETGGAPAYWPWIQVVRAYARASGRSTEDVENPAEEPQASRAQLFESFVTLLRSAAQVRPVLVVLDDLHRADTSSLLVLAEVARRLSDMRLLVLASYRDDELDEQHPLTGMLAELDAVPWRRRLVLEGLSAPDVQALLSAGTQEGLEDAELALASAMHRESDGNPFFVHELVRHLIETRRLAHRGGHWTGDAAAIAELGIPDGVRDVVGQRLTRRSSECLRVLNAAAVIGREFPVSVLPQVAGLDANQVNRAVKEALDARIIRPLRHRDRDRDGDRDRDRRYIFSHTLIRETLYSDISLTRRARLHGKVGEAFETVYGDRSSGHLSELAHHFAEAAAAGNPDKAIEFGRSAGEQAMRQFAYEAAAGHLRRTLKVLDRGPSVDLGLRCELLLELGDAE